MDGTPNIARVGALVGDPALAGMLGALMDGRALSAGELAHEVGVAAQTASSHLAKLEQGGLLWLRKQGRLRPREGCASQTLPDGSVEIVRSL